MSISAERKLSKQRETLDRILETVPVAVTYANRDGRIMSANKRAEELFGLNRDQTTWRTFDAAEWEIADLNGDPIPPEQLPFSQVMRTKSRIEGFRHRITRPDGQHRILSISGSPVLGADGEVEFVVFAIQDITGHIASEQILTQSHHFKESVLRAIPDLVFHIDRNGVFVSNPTGRHEDLLVPPEQFVGKPCDEVLPGWLADLTKRKVLECLKTGQLIQYDYTLTVTGREEHFETRMVPLDADAVITIVRDVTEWRNANTEVRRLLDEQKMLMREAQHRIKNDMYLVQSLLSLQSAQTDNDEARTLLLESANRVDIMGRIYDTLYRDGHTSTIPIHQFVPDLIENIQRSSMLQAVQVDQEIVKASLPARFAVAVGIIINELLVNSLKYAFPDDHDSKPCIRIVIDQPTAGDIRFSVRDNGVGYPETILTGHADGFGFTVVRALVEQHGGTLKLVNDPGAHATAIFPIPEGTA